ncbi:response regulator transcription factor [Novosphingobium sp.]|uniref:response regulator transcription factor n=1 Tax=Novosphingobium sp. TaxID=1874826 RepID=UPI002FE2BFEC
MVAPLDNSPLTRPLVAVVDDDAGVRGSLDSLLRSEGLTSIGFARAEDLLASDLLRHVTTIVTDLHMPGMTGLAMQAELRRRNCPQPVIVMTGYPTDAAREQAMSAGASAFLAKPIDPDVLLAAIVAGLN